MLLLEALSFAEQFLGRPRTARLMFCVCLGASLCRLLAPVAAAVSVLDGPPAVLGRRLHLAPRQLQPAQVPGVTRRIVPVFLIDGGSQWRAAGTDLGVAVAEWV